MLKKRSKRERILDAAFEIYREAGFTDVRMEDVARKAGVGKGTMYQYFKSKEALLEAAVEGCVIGYVTRLTALLQADSSLEESIRQWTLFHRESSEQSSGMMEIMHSEGFVMSKTLKETLYGQRKLVTGLVSAKVKRLIEMDELPLGTDHELVLAMLFGTLTHYYMPNCHGIAPERMPTEKFVQLMKRALTQLGD